MLAAATLALILAPRPAHADCAAGPSYTLTAMGNTVAVCLRGDPTDRCSPYTPPTFVLRQDEATGEVVSLSATCDVASCFNDECVPPGTYRYGLAAPFACGCGGAPFFAEVTVEAAPSFCGRDPTSPVPMAVTVTPPWVRGTNIVASVTCPEGGWGGCEIVGSDRSKVLAVDFLVAAVGLAAMIGRRRRAPPRT